MLVTSDPGVAHDWLRATYPGYLPEETNSRRGFRFQAVHEQAGRIGVSRLSYSTSADNNVAPDVMLVVQPLTGAMLVRQGREEIAVPPGATVLLPAGQAIERPVGRYRGRMCLPGRRRHRAGARWGPPVSTTLALPCRRAPGRCSRASTGAGTKRCGP